jgi:hypothetical protein
MIGNWMLALPAELLYCSFSEGASLDEGTVLSAFTKVTADKGARFN